MVIETRHITVSGIKVAVVRKDIKNLHLGVYPPQGRVRVAVPLVVNDEAVRLAVIDKLGWIKRQKASFAEHPRQTQREMVNGESHYLLGQRYRLRLHEVDAPARVAVRGIASLDLNVEVFDLLEVGLDLRLLVVGHGSDCGLRAFNDRLCGDEGGCPLLPWVHC